MGSLPSDKTLIKFQVHLFASSLVQVVSGE
jgi:hypothetical protein